MPQVSVLFARFPFGRCDDPDSTDWLVRTVLRAKQDPRISDVHHWRMDDTPITMSRNACLAHALKIGVDVVCLLDSDMAPDLHLLRRDEPGCKPFWDSSLDFLLAHRGPCVVAAPYCGPPPVSNVYVFRWASHQNPGMAPGPDLRLEQFSREEAAYRTGIERVAALPTGLMLLDTRALAALEPPYFRYEWADATESAKASTEDVVFTRDLDMAGIPQYVNWDAWAGHWKRVCVAKPQLIHSDQVREQFRQAVLRGGKSDERTLMMEDRHGPERGARERLGATPPGGDRADGGGVLREPPQRPRGKARGKARRQGGKVHAGAPGANGVLR